MRDDGHHHVQLQLSVLGGDGHARVVSEYLEADLIHHLWNRWIDFAGHDRRPRLHRRQPDLVETRTWATREQAQVTRDLAQVHGQHSELRAEAGDVPHALHQLNAILSLPQFQLGGLAQILEH